MENARAVWSVLVGLLALMVLAGGALAASYVEGFGLPQVGAAVGGGILLSVTALSLARRARFEYQRRLGRIGGAGVAALGRSLALLALVLGLTAALAFGVFAVLTLVLE